MLKVIPIKLLSSLLLAVIMLVTIDGACQNGAAVALASELSCQVLVVDATAPCPCPGAPATDHDAPGHCDECDGCSCGASLFGHLFRYLYHPFTTALTFLDRTRYIPEVYPPRFTPPPDLA